MSCYYKSFFKTNFVDDVFICDGCGSSRTGYCPHSKGVNESRLRNVPATCPVSLWGHCLASMLTRFIGMRFLSMGLFEGEGVLSSPLHYSGIEALHQRGNSQYSQDMLQKVMDYIRVRAEICLRSNGAHLSDIIFKK